MLDWEYASAGDPFFDLAVFSEAAQLSIAKSKLLLDAYCDGADKRDNHRLQVAVLKYRYLELLWYSVQIEKFSRELLEKIVAEKLNKLLASINLQA